MHGCFNLVSFLCSLLLLLLMLLMSPRLVLFVGLLLLSFLSFWDFLGLHTRCWICLNLLELQSVFQRPKRINFRQKYLYFLRTHGRVRPIQIPCAWTQSSWSERSCPTSTTRAAVLSSMVWAHADGHLAIAEDVTASVSTSVPSSVQLATAGTLYWKSTHESDLCLAVECVVQSTVSTSTSFISSTHLGISMSKSPIHSTVLTNIAMSTHSSGIAQHSFHSSVPASSSWHSICELTRGSHNGWWWPHLWIWSQSSLARGQRSLRQSEDQRPDFSSLHSSISLHAKTGHWRMWSFETTSGGLVVSTGQQLLASEAGSWAWSLLDSDWGHCSGCVHDGALDSTPQQGGRHRQSRLLQGQTGWETSGQDEQHQVCSPTGCWSHPWLGPHAHSGPWHPARAYSTPESTSSVTSAAWRHNGWTSISECHRSFSFKSSVCTHPCSSSSEFSKPSTSCTTGFWPFLSVGHQYHSQPVDCPEQANISRSPSFQQMVERTQSLRT